MSIGDCKYSARFRNYWLFTGQTLSIGSVNSDMEAHLYRRKVNNHVFTFLKIFLSIYNKVLWSIGSQIFYKVKLRNILISNCDVSILKEKTDTTDSL